MAPPSVSVLGVDRASDPKNVGLAAASVRDGATIIEELAAVRSEAELDAWLVARLSRTEPVLIALDAPLGWPTPLGDQLASHRAGNQLSGTAHQLFRRMTDDRIHEGLRHVLSTSAPSGYKGKDGGDARVGLVRSLQQDLDISPEGRGLLERSDHLLDAALCTLAAADFLRGDVIGVPADAATTARREGWIWARPRRPTAG